jgi:hypothetical protein
MALPTVQQVGSNVTNAGAVAADIPITGIAIDDYVVMVIEHADEAVAKPTPSATAGFGTWTQIGTTVVQGGVRLTVWGAFVTSVPVTAPTVSDSGDHQQHRCIRIRGTDLTTPVHGTQASTDATSDTSGSITGFTTTVNDCLIILCAAGDLPDATGTTEYSAWTNTNLANLTERADNSVATGNGGAKAIATGELATAGPIGDTTYTKVNAAVKAHLCIAIQPPGIGTTSEKTGALVAGTSASGDRVREKPAAGALVADTSASGADVRTAAETGSLVADTTAASVRVRTANRTGAVLANARPQGEWYGEWPRARYPGAATYPGATTYPGFFGVTENVYEKTGSLVAGGALAGEDVREAAETGSLTAAGLSSGADSFEPTETGALATAGQLAGADVFAAAETGALTAGSTLVGVDVHEAARTGSLTAGTRQAGTSERIAGGVPRRVLVAWVELETPAAVDVGGVVHAKTGTLAAGTQATGTDVYTAAETGALAASGRLAGADAFQATETGVITPKAFVAATDAFTAAETGSITTNAFLAGSAVTTGGTTYNKAGSLTTSGLLAGVDAFTAAKTGTLTTGVLLAGGRIREKPRTGTVQTSVITAGTDSVTFTEAGVVATAAAMSATDVFTAIEAGTIATVALVAGFAVPPVGVSVVQTVPFDTPTPGGQTTSQPVHQSFAAPTPIGTLSSAPSTTTFDAPQPVAETPS